LETRSGPEHQNSAKRELGPDWKKGEDFSCETPTGRDTRQFSKGARTVGKGWKRKRREWIRNARTSSTGKSDSSFIVLHGARKKDSERKTMEGASGKGLPPLCWVVCFGRFLDFPSHPVLSLAWNEGIRPYESTTSCPRICEKDCARLGGGRRTVERPLREGGS